MEHPETRESLYNPVDPYRLSAAHGAKNVLGRTRPAPTMDEVKVPKRSGRYYSSYYPRYGAGRTAPPEPPRESAASESSLSSTRSTMLSKSEKLEEPQETEAKHDEPEPEVPPSLLALLLGTILDQLPRQLYLYLHLRMPTLYWSRVSRVFQDADMTMGEIKHMALDVAQHGESDRLRMEQGLLPYASSRSPSWAQLRSSWDHFITSLVAEWSTLNIISALLLSAILTILQIESAMAWPLARFSALLSLLCALMSLLYGCIYIIRFSTMKRTTKAAEWAFESQSNRTAIFWNVWVMLSLPAVWLGWSMIFFVICVMTMVWQTGTTADEAPPELPFSVAVGPRTVVSAILALGLLYLALITGTMRRYGVSMDEAWKARVRSWVEEIKAEEANSPLVIIAPRPRRFPPTYGRDEKYTPLWYENGRVDHTGYPGPYRQDSAGWPPAQAPPVGEPKPEIPFVDAPAPGTGHRSAVSHDLYQGRYRPAPPRTPSPPLYGGPDEGVQPRLLLPPSDDRTFKKQEYIELRVLSWLSDIERYKDSGESPMSPGPDDNGSDGLPPVEQRSPRLRWTSVIPEAQDPVLPSAEDYGDGDEVILGLGLSDSKIQPGEERVASWLNEQSSVPFAGHGHPGEPQYQQTQPELRVDTTQDAADDDANPTPSPSVTTNETPQVPGPYHSAPPLSKSPATHEDGLPPNAVLGGPKQSHHNGIPDALLGRGSDDLIDQPTHLDGLSLRPMDNVQLGTQRALPYPELGPQSFSKEGSLVKILRLQHQGEKGKHEPPMDASSPGEIPPQVWHAFTLDVLSAWSNLGYRSDTVSVNCDSGQLWWSPQEQRTLLNFLSLVERWSSTAFSRSQQRLVVVGEEHVSDTLPHIREIVFAVYMAPLDVDPLVVEFESGGKPASFIRFYCDGMWGPGVEPDIYVRGPLSVPAGNSKPLESA